MDGDPVLKTCPDCGVDRPTTEFGRNRSRPDGLACYCKPCFRRRSNEHYRRAREAVGATVRPRETFAEGYKRCAQCGEVKALEHFDLARSQSGGHNCYCKPCRAGRDRAARFLRPYGLTEAQLADLVARQGGRCAICRDAPAAHVDHDHVGGHVRGVLCFSCNAALGQFRDRVDVLRAAAAYVERTTWQKRRVGAGVYRLDPPPALGPTRPPVDLSPLLAAARR